uniref:CCHC-type domain-containing protein n=1 Tax=Cannabis sativa TaxID=3483 RepID=A0A803NVQ8_CANSA
MISNPEFNRWMRLDQFLLSWLMSTNYESMIGHVFNCATSSKIWNTLEQLFGTASGARQIHLMNQLQSTKKGSLAIDECLFKMKNLADGTEYEAVVVNLTSRDNLTLVENQSGPPTTNGCGNSNNSRGRGRGSYGGRSTNGGGRGYSNGNRPICQLCGRTGHTVQKCYRSVQNWSHYLSNMSASSSSTCPIRKNKGKGLHMPIMGRVLKMHSRSKSGASFDEVIIGGPYIVGNTSKALDRYARTFRHEQRNEVLAVEKRDPKQPQLMYRFSGQELAPLGYIWLTNPMT